jgi:hypothetical protein
MKRISKIKAALFVACLFVMSSSMLNGQIDELGKFMAGGSADAQKLFGAYLKPWAAGFGHDLNAGWYHTAKPHKLWGFDVNFSANLALVPKADLSYDASLLGLNGTLTSGPNGTMASTAAGKDEDGPVITYNVDGKDVSYSLPNGTGIKLVPSPMFQAGIGLIKNTELAVRFIPNVTIGNAAEFNLWGVAIKHDIMQWLPIVDKVPFLHISVLGGYTRLNTVINMNVLPSDIGLSDPADVSVFDDQTLNLEVQSFTFSALASIDIPVVTVYVGAGISNTKTNLSLLGTYPTPTAADVNARTKDPLSLVLKGKDGNTTKPRLSAGLTIKMGPVHLFGEYTYANYSLVTTGLAVSIR